MKEEDRILAERVLTANLTDKTAYRHEQRILVNNEEELESIFSAYQKLYAKKPFCSVCIDVYWEEPKP